MYKIRNYELGIKKLLSLNFQHLTSVILNHSRRRRDDWADEFHEVKLCLSLKPNNHA